ncbi:MAG: hypothetical protein ORN57_00135, partial [Alphaproteobacteria bacterium]|nr:hypothetical protein [Alphaproteobacteria bacterium]
MIIDLRMWLRRDEQENDNDNMEFFPRGFFMLFTDVKFFSSSCQAKSQGKSKESPRKVPDAVWFLDGFLFQRGINFTYGGTERE